MKIFLTLFFKFINLYKSQPHLKDLKRIAKILDVDIREWLLPTKESKY